MPTLLRNVGILFAQHNKINTIFIDDGKTIVTYFTMDYSKMTTLEIVDHIRSDMRLHLIKKIHKEMLKDREEKVVDKVLDRFESCVEENEYKPVRDRSDDDYDPIDAEIMDQVFG